MQILKNRWKEEKTYFRIISDPMDLSMGKILLYFILGIAFLCNISSKFYDCRVILGPVYRENSRKEGVNKNLQFLSYFRSHRPSKERKKRNVNLEVRLL